MEQNFKAFTFKKRRSLCSNTNMMLLHRVTVKETFLVENSVNCRTELKNFFVTESSTCLKMKVLLQRLFKNLI